jgi:GTPase SAR1 family protein
LSSSRHLVNILKEAKSSMQNKNSKNGITIGLMGGSGRGKSTLIRKILLDQIYNSKEYIIHIFTESANSDALQNLSKDVTVDGMGIDPDTINFCYKTNQEYDKRYNFVIVIDDCIHIRHQKMIERMFLIMRNSNITSLVSLQHPKLIPASIRSSLYFAICMGFNSDENDEVAVRSYLSGYMPGKNMYERICYYQEWTKTSHRFFMLDNLNHKCYKVDEKYMCTELPLIKKQQEENLFQSKKRKRSFDNENFSFDEYYNKE